MQVRRAGALALASWPNPLPIDPQGSLVGGGDEERVRSLGTVLAEERVLEAPLAWPVYVASLTVFARKASCCYLEG